MRGDTAGTKEGEKMCLNPIKLTKVTFVDDITGEYVTRLQKRIPDFFDCNYPGYRFEDIEVACGKCLECLQVRAKQWSFRIVAEAKCHQENCFITLTYKNAPKSLNKRDYQLFLKRLRKHIAPVKIRYFGCGEYGSKGLRPHYHFIIFGWKPKDLKKFGNLYGSKELEDIWKLGFVSVGEVNLETAKYTAKYLQKLNTIKEGCLSPFTTMSLKPGIGLDYFKTHNNLRSDQFIVQGQSIPVPRYFIEWSRRNLFFNHDKLKKNRQLKAKLFVRNDNIARKNTKMKQLS